MSASTPPCETAPGPTTRYLGPLITDTTVPGERKRDGVIPAHPGGGALQVAHDRWVIFFATLDPAGWDCNRSILYQLRARAPDGPVLREGIIERGVEDWDPLGRNDRLIKSCGMPIAFGVPEGAVLDGKPMPNANVFVVKWYRWAHLRDGERILHPSHGRHEWAEGLAIKQQTLRVEWMQFRFSRARDEIEPLTQPGVLRQRNYESGEAFCSLGPGVQMNHAMKPPVAEDPSCLTWVSCDSFTPYNLDYRDHGAVAPVRFAFHAPTGLYEWTETGRSTTLSDHLVGEASVNRIDEHYIVTLRCFEYDGRTSDTVWFRMRDLFGDWGAPTYTRTPSVPRIAFTCGDGVLRLFTNAPVPCACLPDTSRAVLVCWDVDPDTLRTHHPRVLLDARAMDWPFSDPLVDMAKLCPAQGNRQLLLVRVIDRSHTATLPNATIAPPEAFAMAGIHALELTLP